MSSLEQQIGQAVDMIRDRRSEALRIAKQHEAQSTQSGDYPQQDAQRERTYAMGMSVALAALWYATQGDFGERPTSESGKDSSSE